MTLFNLPDLGEGLPDAEIREWFVQIDDYIKMDQPMVAMETAKAVVDIPAPFNGKVTQLYGKAGDIIKTGTPLIDIEEENQSKLSEFPDCSKRIFFNFISEPYLLRSNCLHKPNIKGSKHNR